MIIGVLFLCLSLKNQCDCSIYTCEQNVERLKITTMKKILSEETVPTAMSEISMWHELIGQALNSLQAVRQVLMDDELALVEKALFENIEHYAKKIAGMSEFVGKDTNIIDELQKDKRELECQIVKISKEIEELWKE